MIAVVTLGVLSVAAQEQSATGSNPPQAPVRMLDVPPGTQVPLVVIRPVRANAVSVGNALFAQTTYPVSVGNRMAIPAGSYVQGQILSFTRPTSKVWRETLRVRFTQLIYANGYAAPLATDAAGDDTMDITLQASPANDLLIDNGAQIELMLTSALRVNAQKTRAAIALSHAPKPGSLASATTCVNIPGTPATPGTPGTPGTPDTVIPGTPDTVIPGANGAPDTVIPGTPATVIPGTPATPGTPGDPGSAGYTCPDRPLVISSVPVIPVQQASSAK